MRGNPYSHEPSVTLRESGLIEHPLSPLIEAYMTARDNRVMSDSQEGIVAKVTARDTLNKALMAAARQEGKTA